MTNKHPLVTFYSTDGIKMLLFKDAIIEFTDANHIHHAFNISSIIRLARGPLSLTVFFPANDKLLVEDADIIDHIVVSHGWSKKMAYKA